MGPNSATRNQKIYHKWDHEWNYDCDDCDDHEWNHECDHDSLGIRWVFEP